MIRRILGRGRSGGGGTSWIYDTSPFYSNNAKIRVRRVSDSVAQNFTPTQITDGTYAAWLNGSEGLLLELNNDGNTLNKAVRIENTGGLKMASTGLIDNRIGASKLNTSFLGNEIDENSVMAMVVGDLSGNSLRYNFGVMGSDSGLTMTFRAFNRTWFLAYKLVGQPIVRIGFDLTTTTASNYNNVIIVDFLNGTPRLRVNGTVYTTPNNNNDTDWSVFEPIDESTINQINMGTNTHASGARPAQYRHFSVKLNSDKTSEEISNELRSIYQ